MEKTDNGDLIKDETHVAVGNDETRTKTELKKKINWAAMIRFCKKWIKHPMNMALLIWLLFVAAGLVALLLLITGLLNQSITRSSDRKRWIEIVNQILNALFTIMCLYQHPTLFHHLILLLRWSTANCDAIKLRRVYCKNQSRQAHERAHLMFVVIFLHIACFSQYVMCGLYWGFNDKNRPEWANILCMALGTSSPAIAGVYTVYSPLGRKCEEPDTKIAMANKPELCSCSSNNHTSNKTTLLVARPEWNGGMFDCCDDSGIACLSFFCTLCVFGWNMERLGFGNMYVHISTFLLLCVAPLWVFSVSALNIEDDTVRYLVGGAGIVLSFFGLMYGGFWRVQTRKRFRLPASAAAADFLRWLFCSCCALAQEVRTGSFYDVGEEGFYTKGKEMVGSMIESSLESSVTGCCESGESSSLNSMETGRDCSADDTWITIEGKMVSDGGGDRAMTPPLRNVIEVDDKSEGREINII